MPGRRRLTRDQSRAETRQRLMDAAERIFAEKGFYGSSVEEITERAGFSRGAFYSNFEDKDELFLALLDRRTNAQIKEVGELLAANPAPADFIAALRKRGVGRANQRAWIMLAHEFWLYALRNPKVRPKLVARERFEREAYQRAVMAQYRTLGISPPGPPEQLALIVQALDSGFAMQQYLDPDTVTEDSFLDALALLTRASVALVEQSAQNDPMSRR